jgi:hypothetical protein
LRVHTDERLLWLHDWGVWSSGEHLPLFSRLRACFGEDRNLIDVPGHLFGRNDDQDGLSFLILSVLFLWDGWLYSDSGIVTVFSHDEWGVVHEPKHGSTADIREGLDRIGVLV